MSIDPASQTVEIPKNVHELKNIFLLNNNIYVFDFDGVVCSSFEDNIYHLNTWKNELQLLHEASCAFNINCCAMELKYQRHLIYQAAAFHLGIGIEPGPATQKIIDAPKNTCIFMLTARSGWYAVERMRIFLKNRQIIPIDIFNVGRVTKEKQLELICKEFNKNDVFFVEDNPAHLDAASKLPHNNLKLVLAEKEPQKNIAYLQKKVVDTIQSAIVSTK